ncbi:MAG: GFA family protein [Sphingomonadaceae bacterium]|nr:GFA family protein [Sphingomonadaceae bacterium]
MSEEYPGGCVCGAVRYVWRPGVRFKSNACHCTDCQMRSGSSFALQQTVRLEDFEVSGEMAEGGFTQPSGARARLYNCPKCHSRIYGTNDLRPGIAIIRAGTFDHNSTITPDIHVWTRSKQPWIVIPEGAVALETQPDSADGWSELVSASSS